MQGFDSVCIARRYGACDLELGGNDQYFNLLAGRTLMNAAGLPKQDIMTFHLLMGTDGEKMSKTKPNCILIDDAPQAMYQKLIGVRDDMILHYYELATEATLEEINEISTRLENGEHPNIIKDELAQRIIMMYHGKKYDPNDESNIEQQEIDIKAINLYERVRQQKYLNGTNLTIMDLEDSIDSSTFRAILINISDQDLVDKIIENTGLFKTRYDAFFPDMITTYHIEFFLNKKEKLVNNKSSQSECIPWYTPIMPNFTGETINLKAILYSMVQNKIISLPPKDSNDLDDNEITIANLLKITTFATTGGDIRNAISGGSVRVN